MGQHIDKRVEDQGHNKGYDAESCTVVSQYDLHSIVPIRLACWIKYFKAFALISEAKISIAALK